MNIKPLKKFGQNYLSDRNILLKISSEIDAKPNQTILEIGPGKGALTELLYQANPELLLVEIDTRVIENLEMKFPTAKIINKDFLEFNLKDEFTSKILRVAGNIPYNLTSPIIFKIIENIEIVNDATLMMQLEVAERIRAKQGSKNYGILSVLTNYFFEVKFCFKISRNVFYPKPNVDSALIHFFRRDLFRTPEFNKLFVKVVKASFGNRRKVLKNSLTNSIFGDVNFERSSIDLSKRAEALSIEEFIILTEFLLQQKIEQ